MVLVLFSGICIVLAYVFLVSFQFCGMQRNLLWGRGGLGLNAEFEEAFLEKIMNLVDIWILCITYPPQFKILIGLIFGVFARPSSVMLAGSIC